MKPAGNGVITVAVPGGSLAVEPVSSATSWQAPTMLPRS
jgi:hypothetical protein